MKNVTCGELLAGSGSSSFISQSSSIRAIVIGGSSAARGDSEVDRQLNRDIPSTDTVCQILWSMRLLIQCRRMVLLTWETSKRRKRVSARTTNVATMTGIAVGVGIRVRGEQANVEFLTTQHACSGHIAHMNAMANRTWRSDYLQNHHTVCIWSVPIARIVRR